jgi:hypothetical protein
LQKNVELAQCPAAKQKKRAGFYETNKGGTAANVVPYIETYKGFFLSEIIDL